MKISFLNKFVVLFYLSTCWCTGRGSTFHYRFINKLQGAIFEYKPEYCKKPPGGGEIVFNFKNVKCSHELPAPHYINSNFYFVCQKNSILICKCKENEEFDKKLRRCAKPIPSFLIDKEKNMSEISQREFKLLPEKPNISKEEKCSCEEKEEVQTASSKVASTLSINEYEPFKTSVPPLPTPVITAYTINQDVPFMSTTDGKNFNSEIKSDKHVAMWGNGGIIFDNVADYNDMDEPYPTQTSMPEKFYDVTTKYLTDSPDVETYKTALNKNETHKKVNDEKMSSVMTTVVTYSTVPTEEESPKNNEANEEEEIKTHLLEPEQKKLLNFIPNSMSKDRINVKEISLNGNSNNSYNSELEMRNFLIAPDFNSSTEERHIGSEHANMTETPDLFSNDSDDISTPEFSARTETTENFSKLALVNFSTTPSFISIFNTTTENADSLEPNYKWSDSGSSEQTKEYDNSINTTRDELELTTIREISTATQENASSASHIDDLYTLEKIELTATTDVTATDDNLNYITSTPTSSGLSTENFNGEFEFWTISDDEINHLSTTEDTTTTESNQYDAFMKFSLESNFKQNSESSDKTENYDMTTDSNQFETEITTIEDISTLVIDSQTENISSQDTTTILEKKDKTQANYKITEAVGNLSEEKKLMKKENEGHMKIEGEPDDGVNATSLFEYYDDYEYYYEDDNSTKVIVSKGAFVNDESQNENYYYSSSSRSGEVDL